MNLRDRSAPEIRMAIAHSKALIAFFSFDYMGSHACFEEITTAWIAATVQDPSRYCLACVGEGAAPPRVFAMFANNHHALRCLSEFGNLSDPPQRPDRASSLTRAK
jgi:hypothetical protein